MSLLISFNQSKLIHFESKQEINKVIKTKELKKKWTDSINEYNYLIIIREFIFDFHSLLTWPCLE